MNAQANNNNDDNNDKINQQRRRCTSYITDYYYTLKLAQRVSRFTSIPSESNLTPSPSSSSSFFSQFSPDGTFFQSPMKPPMYCFLSVKFGPYDTVRHVPPRKR